ncbi:hypothetical protein THIOM_004059 [Candidatus Thiomargarita nelsonii]|uniref:Uncharacterized protein n=1 Tax=Candidatus Thiomargarita nelsonii TaxID=1003181 RepID=A0A176RX09_9GAMM|nr:hypothetical protein THIOM_004059 [Candidatus Thiomargarita nelsonii]
MFNIIFYTLFIYKYFKYNYLLFFDKIDKNFEFKPMFYKIMIINNYFFVSEKIKKINE